MIEGIIGFALGVGVFAAWNWSIQRAATSIYMREKGARGNQAREANSSQVNSAILRAIELKKEGKDVKTIIATVAAEFPLVALQVGSKILSGRIKGLEGLI